MKVAKRKILFSFSLLLALLWGGASCSSPQEQDSFSLSAATQSYEAKNMLAVDLGGAARLQCFLSEQAIYYVPVEEDARNAIWKREFSGRKAEELLRLEKNEVLQGYTVTDNGEIIMAVQRYDLTETGEADYDAFVAVELRKIDNVGNLVWKQEFTDEEKSLMITHILTSSDGRICAASGQELFFFEESGKLIGKKTVKGEMILLLAEAGSGRIAVIHGSQTRQMLTVYQGTDGTEVYQKDFRNTKQWFGGEGRLYFAQEDMLAEYDWESDSAQAILNFTDCGIDMSAVLVFRALEERGFLVGLKEEEDSMVRLVRLEQTAKEETPKTQLMLATMNPQVLQATTVSFNTKNSNYEMKQKSFDYEQLDQFHAYLAGQSSADVIELPGFHFYKLYIQNKYLLDLLPFIEKSEVISLDDFLPGVIEDMTVDGGLYSIPKEIDISTLACPTELLEGKTSWTIEEFLEFMEKYPNAMSGAGLEKEAVKQKILQATMFRGMGGFVDGEAGTASFDSERFRSILERIAALEISMMDQGAEERAQNGEAVLLTLSILKTEAVLQAEQNSGRELTLIGYPGSGANEERGGGIISYSGMLGMHSATAHAEAAWDYVESYLAGALKANDFYFTTGREAFEEKLQEGMEEQAPEIAQIQIDKVRKAFQEGAYLGNTTYDILDILKEETEAYFQGNKELADTVDIIQNRVQLYLNE